MKKSSPIEIELWMNRVLQEDLKTSKKGSEDRVSFMVKALERIADSDEIFGDLIRIAAEKIYKSRESGPVEVEILQKLLLNENKLKDLNDEIRTKESEVAKLEDELSEVKRHISRRKTELANLEESILQHASIFTKQKQLDDQINELLKSLDDPIIIKKEEIREESPQVLSLRHHNKMLRDKIEELKRCIEIAEAETQNLKRVI